MRIAVCDDEEAQRQLIAKYLQEWSLQRKRPVEILTFSGGEDFLFQWEDDKAFDLLVLDIEMAADLLRNSNAVINYKHRKIF